MKLLCTAVKPSTCFQSIKQIVCYSHAWFDYDALPITKLPPSYSIYLGFAESLLEPVTLLWGERPSNYHPDLKPQYVLAIKPLYLLKKELARCNRIGGIVFLKVGGESPN